MFLTSHPLQVFIAILHQKLSSFSWMTSLWFSFSSSFTHWSFSKPSLSHILINASINVLSAYFYTFKFLLQDNFHGCLHWPFIPFLPSLADSSSDTWSSEILTHPRDSYALHKIKKPNKPKTLRITLLNRWQHYTKINKYRSSKQWCSWRVSSSLSGESNR